MIVDCTTCTVRGAACGGCVVTLLFGGEPGRELPWHSSEAAGDGRAGPPAAGPDDIDRAVAVLAAAGMLHASELPLQVAVTTVERRRLAFGA